jgi:hypothetical protein
MLKPRTGVVVLGGSGSWHMEAGDVIIDGGNSYREGRTDPGAHRGAQSGRARLSPLQAERRGALREDGAAPGGRDGLCHRLAQGRTSPMKARGKEGRA